MVVVREEAGRGFYIGLHYIVDSEEVETVNAEAGRYFSEHSAEALVLDIRGCKPIDAACCEGVRRLLEMARDHGTGRFFRVGDGTLCAVQMTAVARAADVDRITQIVADGVDIGCPD